MKILKIWGLGHSNLALSEFIQKLQNHKIRILVDIRTYPQSRWCPHFNEKPLNSELNKASITYLYRGKNLGGRGENVNYDEAISELVDLAEGRKRVTVLS